MKKTAILIVGLSLTLTLLTATPAKAHHPHWFGPGFSVGVVINPFFYAPRYYYPAPPRFITVLHPLLVQDHIMNGEYPVIGKTGMTLITGR
jgi:hypothetical protein